MFDLQFISSSSTLTLLLFKKFKNRCAGKKKTLQCVKQKKENLVQLSGKHIVNAKRESSRPLACLINRCVIYCISHCGTVNLFILFLWLYLPSPDTGTEALPLQRKRAWICHILPSGLRCTGNISRQNNLPAAVFQRAFSLLHSVFRGRLQHFQGFFSPSVAAARQCCHMQGWTGHLAERAASWWADA